MPPNALSTDLYELTMMAGYFERGIRDRATFELFVRSLPVRRGYLVAAGLEQSIAYLEHLCFTPEQIAYLRALPNLRRVSREFFEEFLPAFRFTGDIWALPEGTPFFEGEPMLRVTAPIAEAQLVETALLATLTFQTSIASKASRLVTAARGRPVLEFGSRRAHGVEAAMLAARAACIGGCPSTSNTEAGWRFEIPVAGTMAHSWVMSFGNELDAFRAYERAFGRDAVFLIDTYDTVAAAQRIVHAGLHPSAVRLDSGPLAELSRKVRATLDAGGLDDVKILASGDLDENAIAGLLADRAPIDGFGVGTALSTSIDAPALGGVYKLVEIERGGTASAVMKLSQSKRSSPGVKQVWRCTEDDTAVRDVIGLADENRDDGAPLLVPVMAAGRRIRDPETIPAMRDRARRLVLQLPVGVRDLAVTARYPVVTSDALDGLAGRLAAELAPEEPPNR